MADCSFFGFILFIYHHASPLSSLSSQHLLDVRENGVRAILWFYELYHLTFVIYEELRIVPWNLSSGSGLIRFFAGCQGRILSQVYIGGVGARTVHVDLLRDEKLSPVLVPGELLDSLLVQWLLVKRVTGEHKNLQSLWTVCLVDLN